MKMKQKVSFTFLNVINRFGVKIISLFILKYRVNHLVMLNNKGHAVLVASRNIFYIFFLNITQ